MDDTQLARIKDGDQLFAIDQQPYMQGYLAVSLLNAYIQYGLSLPQKPLLTGPAIIGAEQRRRRAGRGRRPASASAEW